MTDLSINKPENPSLTITQKYTPLAKTRYCFFKRQYLQHNESGLVLKHSQKTLDKVINEVERLTPQNPESGAFKKTIKGREYLFFKEGDTLHLYQRKESLGHGAYSSVHKMIDLAKGTAHAGKISRNKKSRELKNEKNNIEFIRDQISEREDLQNLLPQKVGGTFTPIIAPPEDFFRLRKKGPYVSILPLAKQSLVSYLLRTLDKNLNGTLIWDFALHELAMLEILEKLRLVHCDIKADNMLIFNDCLHLIDLGSLLELPEDGSPPETDVPYTKLYFTKKAYDLLNNATTYQEKNRALQYRQRVGFAHALFELLRLYPLGHQDIEDHMIVNTRYTEMDITQTSIFKRLPQVAQDVITTLLDTTVLDEKLPDMSELIKSMKTEEARQDYLNAFSTLKIKRPSVLTNVLC